MLRCKYAREQVRIPPPPAFRMTGGARNLLHSVAETSGLIKLLWLLDSKGNNPIDLYICSSGGYISEAKAIGNAIHSLDSKVNTYATGRCASSALRTVSYGTGIRAAYCNTMMMFHGNDYDNNETETSYDAVAKGIEIEDWKRISKITEQRVTDSSEFNMTPQQALELGFIDTIICR